MKINKEWHLKNKMPKNPTLEQRIKWHVEHARPACRQAGIASAENWEVKF